MRRSFAEEVVLFRRSIFDMPDDEFDAMTGQVSTARRLALQFPRGWVSRKIETDGLARVGSGVECAVFGDEATDTVTKVFWPSFGSGKYDRLQREGELIAKSLGSIATPTETTFVKMRFGSISGLRIVMQQQPWYRPLQRLPEQPDQLSDVAVFGLEKLLSASQAINDASNGREWLDISPANFHCGEEGIRYFDMSLFDPATRGQSNTAVSIENHTSLGLLIAEALSSR